MDFTYVFDKDYYSGLRLMLEETSIGKLLRWWSLCHRQPVMEHTAVYVGEEVAEGYCRRCGKWGDLTYN